MAVATPYAAPRRAERKTPHRQFTAAEEADEAARYHRRLALCDPGSDGALIAVLLAIESRLEQLAALIAER